MISELLLKEEKDPSQRRKGWSASERSVFRATIADNTARYVKNRELTTPWCHGEHVEGKSQVRKRESGFYPRGSNKVNLMKLTHVFVSVISV